MSISSKAGTGAIALVLAFGLSSCGEDGAGEGGAVFTSVVEPVEVSVVAPQYVADIPHSRYPPPGRLVRRGDDERRVRGTYGGVWLNDGRIVLNYLQVDGCFGRPVDPTSCGDRSGVVLDLGTGADHPVPGLGSSRLAGPTFSSTAARVNLVVSETTSDAPVERPWSYSADLTAPVRVAYPDFAEDRKYQVTSISDTLHSVGAWDYASFSVGDEERSAHRGYVMRERGSDQWTKVLVDEGIQDLWVTRDGSALLGVRRLARADECDDCDRAEEIVEIDPRNGEIAGDYGAPPSYTKKWRSVEVDKIGGRVLVRYVIPGEPPENKGVWEYDGTWDLVEGTDSLFAWWQGPEDRLEIEPTATQPVDGLRYDLYWVRGAERTKLPGHVSSDALFQPSWMPGTIAPPD